MQLGTAGGAGAIYNRGTLSINGGANIANLAIGQSVNGYGYLLHDSAVNSSANEVGVGGAGGGNGVLEVRSGTFTTNNWLTITRSDNATAPNAGMLLVSGGTLVPPNVAGQFRAASGNAGSASYSVIDVGAGGNILGGNIGNLDLSTKANSGNITTLSVHDGGSIRTTRIFANNGSGIATVNLNGGVLVSAANGNILDNNLDAVVLYANGATLDTNSFNSTVNATISAPFGDGITSMPILGPGSGYIGRPIVRITDPTGLGASAVANFNEATGELTGITITSPGSGYTSPTIELIGGGALTAATLNAPTLGANVTTGGLTKTGTGILTMASSGNSYLGPTRIAGGILNVPLVDNGGVPSALGASSNAASNLVFDGGTLRFSGIFGATDRNFTIAAGKTATIDVSDPAATLTLNGGAAATNGNLTKTGLGTLILAGSNQHTGLTSANNGVLALSGTFTGPLATNGGRINAGFQSVGTLTVPSLTLGATGGFDFDFSAGTNDVITIGNAGGLTLGTSSINLFEAGTTTPFQTNGTYTLFDYNTSFNGSLIGAFSIANSQASKFYSITNDAGTTRLLLTISDSAITEWAFDGSGNWGDATKWSAGVPNSAGALATFGGVLTALGAPATITVDGPKTVGSVVFDNFNTYNIVGTPADILTFNSAGGTSQINAINGTHSISAPINLVSALTASTTAGNTLTLSGNITGGQPVSVSGTGTVLLSGSNALGGVVTINSGTLEINGAAAVGGSTSIVEKNGAVFRIGGTTVTLPQAITFDLAGGQATGISGAENGTGNFTIEVLDGATVTASGLVSSEGGSFVKRGGGTLHLTNGGANVLANVGGIAASVQAGELVFDGGPGATYAVTGGELAVGDNTPTAATVTLSSGTLNVGTFTSVGRGNGSTSLKSTLNINGGTLNTAQLFTGFANGVAGYNAEPIINISGSGVVNATAGPGVRLGESAGARATMNVSGNGTLTSLGEFQIGFGGTALITVAGNATLNIPELGLGHGNNAAGNTGAGALIQSGGTVQQAGTFGADWRIGGYTGANDALSYGSYTITGGTLTNARPFQVGAFGQGVLDVAGGTVNITANFPVVGRFAGGVGSMNVTSGSFNQTSPTTFMILGENGTGVVTVDGTGALNVAAAPGGAGNGGGTGGIRLGHAAGGVGILNLNGGTVTASGIAQSAAGTVSNVYFDGGTLRANAANPTYMQGLTSTVIGPGGAVIDTNGNNIGIGQGLLAPTGQGVASIAVGNAGDGYIGRPIVRITGGGGTGATAIATVTNGMVTGIQITNPGVGYTSEPIVELLGGGALVPASTGSVSLAANVATGGLNKIGAGTLNLNGVSTYTGPTTIAAGGIGGTGTLASNVTVQSGATLAPGNGGVGTLTVAGLTLAAGSNLVYEWDATLLSDRVTVTSANGLVINGGNLSLFNSGATTIFSTNGVYNLLEFNGTIGGIGTGALSVDAGSQAAGKTYSFGQSGNFVTLTIGNVGVTPNFWNVDASGNWTTSANWSLGAAPNAPQAFAAFGGGGTPITAPRTVTLDANQTVGTLAFNSAQPFTIAGANTLTLNNSTDPAQITVSNGSHTIGVAMTVAATTPSVQFTTVNVTDSLTVSAPLAGNAGITKNGPGTVVFSAPNTYSGNIAVNDGALTLTGAGTLGNVNNTVVVSGGVLNLGGTTQTVGATTINGGTISNGTLAPVSLTHASAGNAVVSAAISGAASVSKTGTGRLTLSGNNTYTGGTTLGGGTLAITSNNSLGDDASPVTFNAGGLAIEGTAATNLGNRPLNGAPAFVEVVEAGHTFTIGQGLTAVANFLKRGLGTLRLAGANNTLAASATINEGTLLLENGTTTNTAGGNNPIQIANAANTTAALTVGAGAILNGGTSELYVGQGVNTANATLNLQAGGTITLNNWLAVGRGGANGTVNMSGGTLNKFGGNGNHVTIGSVGGSGIFNQSGGVINSSDSDFYVGEVGTGVYNVSGTAEANLQILQIGVQAAGTGTVNLNGGVVNTRQVNRGAGAATLNLNGGTLRAADLNPAFIADTITTNVGAGGAIIDTVIFDVTIPGALNHDPALGATLDGGLTKRGSATLSLTGFSSYTGPTVVEQGTLAVAGSISGSSNFAVRAGATLDATLSGGLFLGSGQALGGSGTVLGNISTNFGTKLSPGDTTGTLTLGGDLDLSFAVGGDASAALLYQLGATSDRISLTSGTLSIGTGVLAFNDFVFSGQAGFGPGTYTLIDSSLAISGSLDTANATGLINGFSGTLAFADGNTDLVLTVVPEPGTAASLLLGATALLALRRRQPLSR